MLRPIVVCVSTNTYPMQILRSEVIDEQITPKGSSALSFLSVVRSIEHDAIDRLVFRVRIYIRDNIDGFEPTAEEIDYPRLLEGKSSLLQYILSLTDF